ncbi:MAG: hypothetical protein WCU00_09675, partial [Candidatus Latescibacterota bacterium]
FGLKGGRFLYGDFGYGVDISRVFKEVEIGVSGIRSGPDVVGSIFFRVPLLPKIRKTRTNYGIDMVKNWGFTYRYDSRGTVYDQNEIIYKAFEPEVGMSFRDFTGMSRPTHFINRAR